MRTGYALPPRTSDHSTVQPAPRASAADGETVPVAIEEETEAGAAGAKGLPPGRLTTYVEAGVDGTTSAPPAP